MDIDSLVHHIRTLDNQHLILERKLHAMLKQPSWSEYEAENLKKQKLYIKDQLTEMYRKRYNLMNEVDFD